MRMSNWATSWLFLFLGLGWKGPGKMIAFTPQIFDLWQDPQERYDVFMNNYTETTWTGVTITDAFKKESMVSYSEAALFLIGIARFHETEVITHDVPRTDLNCQNSSQPFNAGSFTPRAY
jgi:hypothetical protein